MKPAILIVEDEDSLGILLTYNLEAAGFAVRLCTRGDLVETFISEKQPDLILLDWMLPGASGIEICRRLRKNKQTQNIPIIMATARGEEEERLRGFEEGADDYMVKPFAMKELVARVKAVLKRTAPSQMAEQLMVGDITLNAATHKVERGTININLGPTEFKLLHYFMQRQGRVLSREQLLDNVWGREVYIYERTVDVHIGRLRKSLKVNADLPNPISTIRGAGYRFELNPQL